MRSKALLAIIVFSVGTAIIWYIIVSRKPDIRRNEANTERSRSLKGYKANVITPINPHARGGRARQQGA